MPRNFVEVYVEVPNFRVLYKREVSSLTIYIYYEKFFIDLSVLTKLGVVISISFCLCVGNPVLLLCYIQYNVIVSVIIIVTVGSSSFLPSRIRTITE